MAMIQYRLVLTSLAESGFIVEENAVVILKLNKNKQGLKAYAHNSYHYTNNNLIIYFPERRTCTCTLVMRLSDMYTNKAFSRQSCK